MVLKGFSMLLLLSKRMAGLLGDLYVWYRTFSSADLDICRPSEDDSNR